MTIGNIPRAGIGPGDEREQAGMATHEPTPEEIEAAKLFARSQSDNDKRAAEQDRTARREWERQVAAEEKAIAKAERDAAAKSEGK